MNWAGNVFELFLAEIDERLLHAVTNLLVCGSRQTDAAWLTDAFKPRGNVDAVAHQIAIALLNDVADVDAEAKIDPASLRNAGVAVNHRVLQLDSAADGVNRAAELGDGTVAGAFDDAAVMYGDCRIDKIAAQRPEAGERAILVRADKPAVSDDVGDQNRCQSPGFSHLCALLLRTSYHGVVGEVA